MLAPPPGAPPRRSTITTNSESAASESRRRRYWELNDFGRGHGLEVGPLHRPIVWRSEADVSYVDLRDREGLVAHYSDPVHGVDVAEIPDIDYFLLQQDGQVLSVSDAVRPGAPFDWVIASHVVEHVPDLIGWLHDLADVVRDDGVLVLIVPDKRFTFDVHRPTTTVGQMLAAHMRNDTVPSVRAVYDHFSAAVGYSARALWNGNTPGCSSRVHSLEEAHERAGQAREGTYVDCHVWVLSPDTFVQQMRELRLGGHSSWYVEEVSTTRENEIEFGVRLRRLPRGSAMAGDVPAEVSPTSDPVDGLAGHEQRLARLALQLDRQRGRAARRLERIRALEKRLDVEREKGSTRELRRSRRRIDRLTATVERQRAELDRLRGTPWKRLVSTLRRRRPA